MSKKDASLDGPNPAEAVRISFHSLFKVLWFLYPGAEITSTQIEGMKDLALIAIENAEDEESEGSVIYSLSDGLAFGFSDNWIEALEYVKAGVQEVWFHKMEQNDVVDGEIVDEREWWEPKEEDLFSEQQYQREKGVDVG